MVGSRRMSVQPLVAATPRYHSHALCYRSLASAQSVTRTKQRQAVFRRPAPLGGLSPSPGFLLCLQDFEFPMCHTLSVPHLRRVVHLVVHVLAPSIPRWIDTLVSRRAEHISSRIDIPFISFEHCDSRNSLSDAPAPNQHGIAVAW